MNKTIAVLKTIGSPFVNNHEPINPVESLDLYDYAFANHIGLLYLDSLQKAGVLDSLADKYNKLRHRYDETMKTASLVGDLLSSEGHNYAIIKTIKPYLATPNDTDILYLGSKSEYKAAMNLLIRKGYNFVHFAPRQAVFCDPRADSVRLDKKGGTYYIDLYSELAADYIVYIDKKKFKQYLTDKVLLNCKVKVFATEAELAICLMHGVFPEQSYQFQDFYVALNFLANLNDNCLEEFVKIVKSNHIKHAVSASLSVTAELHRVAFGFVPDELSMVLKILGENSAEVKALQRQELETPYKFKFITFFYTVLERGLDPAGLLSFFVQGFHMLNPKVFLDVIKTIIKKNTVGTYHQV